MQVQKDDIRKKILEVSERLFIRNGYDNTSLKQIAERSYISKSNIYRYFSSKEEIYDILVEPARQEIMRTIDSFFNEDYIGKFTPDKIEEIAAIVSVLMSRQRPGMLIMLNAGSTPDAERVRQIIIDKFMVCPIKDDEFKRQVAGIILYGLTDILLKHDKEEEILKRLRLLMYYHYLGLDGVKSNLCVFC